MPYKKALLLLDEITDAESRDCVVMLELCRTCGVAQPGCLNVLKAQYFEGMG